MLDPLKEQICLVWVSSWQYFRGFCRKSLPGDSWHSNGYEFCPSPLLADIFLFSYEAEFIQSLLSTGKKQLASRFNLTYRFIDDVLSINNPEFENFLGQMYPAELEIKDTTESITSASYLDLFLSIGRDGQMGRQLTLTIILHWLKSVKCNLSVPINDCKTVSANTAIFFTAQGAFTDNRHLIWTRISMGPWIHSTLWFVPQWQCISGSLQNIS